MAKKPARAKKPRPRKPAYKPRITQAEFEARYLRTTSPYNTPLFPASDVSVPLRMVMGKWVRDKRRSRV